MMRTPGERPHSIYSSVRPANRNQEQAQVKSRPAPLTDPERGFRFDALPIHAPDVQTAAQGLTAAKDALPHADQIQKSFGRHDLSSVRAALNAEARQATASLGAVAYAQGERVAFSRPPDLFTAAHEATHVLQQRRGVAESQRQSMEDHANQVASLVTRGASAESLLDRGLAQASGPRTAGAGQSASVQFLLETKFGNEEKKHLEKNEVFPEGIIDKNLNNQSLLGFENQLFATIRSASQSFIEPVRQVISFWKDFVIKYFLEHNIENLKWSVDPADGNVQPAGSKRHRIDELLERPELARKAYQQNQIQSATTATERILTLANAAESSVELGLLFLRVLFDSFLDKDVKQEAERSRATLEKPGVDFDSNRRLKHPGTKKWDQDYQDRKDTRDTIPSTEVEERVVEGIPAGDPLAEARVKPGHAANLLKARSNFYDETRKLHLPVLALISGSTADYISLAQLAGITVDKKPKEAEDYAMAVLFYIGLPQHHSFHEIVSQLKRSGFVKSYDPKPDVGDYPGPLTEEVKGTAAYRDLMVQYPTLLYPAARSAFINRPRSDR